MDEFGKGGFKTKVRKGRWNMISEINFEGRYPVQGNTNITQMSLAKVSAFRLHNLPWGHDHTSGSNWFDSFSWFP